VTAGLRTVRDKQLFVEETGEGPAVVLVHGLGGTTNFYEPLLAALSGHQVLRYDFDGHGRSPLHGPFAVDDLVQDLAELIEQHAGGTAHVVAHSFGTQVAQHLAASRPELVDSLVLLGPVREQPDAGKQATRARADTVRAHGMQAVADAVVAAGTAEAARQANPLVGPFVRELLLGQDPQGYAQACEALAGATNADLTAITCRVLLLTGDQDKVSPPATSAAMAEALKDATTSVTPGVGHWTVPEAPAFVAEHLRSHLSA
jgi:pimeloyl-ACP methyl ester carboxylesterase